MSDHHHFVSVGGGIHHSAIVGQPPEMEGWDRGDSIFAPSVAPTARIEAYVTIDAGVRKPTRVGSRSWILKHGHVGHDAQVGEDCVIATGAIIGGHAILEDGVKVGLNAVVLPFVKVGAGARIGAGAVVVDHVPPGTVWAGNPARRIEPSRSRKRLKCCGGLPPDHHPDCEFQ